MSVREQWIVRELKKGDHLRVRHMNFYHHGIYEGDGTVIHFAGPDSNTLTEISLVTVRRDSLEHFSMGRDIEVRAYSLRERLHLRSADRIVECARSHLGEKGYDIIYNNCEHFATMCTTGKAYSNQIETLREQLEQTNQ